MFFYKWGNSIRGLSNDKERRQRALSALLTVTGACWLGQVPGGIIACQHPPMLTLPLLWFRAALGALVDAPEEMRTNTFLCKHVRVTESKTAKTILHLLFHAPNSLPGVVWMWSLTQALPGASPCLKPQGQLSSQPEQPATSQIQSLPRKHQLVNGPDFIWRGDSQSEVSKEGGGRKFRDSKNVNYVHTHTHKETWKGEKEHLAKQRME